jgi:hypothetical protein
MPTHAVSLAPVLKNILKDKQNWHELFTATSIYNILIELSNQLSHVNFFAQEYELATFLQFLNEWVSAEAVDQSSASVFNNTRILSAFNAALGQIHHFLSEKRINAQQKPVLKSYLELLKTLFAPDHRYLLIKEKITVDVKQLQEISAKIRSENWDLVNLFLHILTTSFSMKNFLRHYASLARIILDLAYAMPATAVEKDELASNLLRSMGDLGGDLKYYAELTPNKNPAYDVHVALKEVNVAAKQLLNVIVHGESTEFSSFVKGGFVTWFLNKIYSLQEIPSLCMHLFAGYCDLDFLSRKYNFTCALLTIATIKIQYDDKFNVTQPVLERFCHVLQQKQEIFFTWMTQKFALEFPNTKNKTVIFDIATQQNAFFKRALVDGYPISRATLGFFRPPKDINQPGHIFIHLINGEIPIGIAVHELIHALASLLMWFGSWPDMILSEGMAEYFRGVCHEVSTENLKNLQNDAAFLETIRQGKFPNYFNAFKWVAYLFNAEPDFLQRLLQFSQAGKAQERQRLVVEFLSNPANHQRFLLWTKFQATTCTRFEDYLKAHVQYDWEPLLLSEIWRKLNATHAQELPTAKPVNHIASTFASSSPMPSPSDAIKTTTIPPGICQTMGQFFADIRCLIIRSDLTGLMKFIGETHYKADSPLPDNPGNNTIMHYAVSNKRFNLEILWILICHGQGTLYVKNNAGQMPIDLLDPKHRDHALALVRKAKANETCRREGFSTPISSTPRLASKTTVSVQFPQMTSATVNSTASYATSFSTELTKNSRVVSTELAITDADTPFVDKMFLPLAAFANGAVSALFDRLATESHNTSLQRLLQYLLKPSIISATNATVDMLYSPASLLGLEAFETSFMSYLVINYFGMLCVQPTHSKITQWIDGKTSNAWLSRLFKFVVPTLLYMIVLNPGLFLQAEFLENMLQFFCIQLLNACAFQAGEKATSTLIACINKQRQPHEQDESIPLIDLYDYISGEQCEKNDSLLGIPLLIAILNKRLAFLRHYKGYARIFGYYLKKLGAEPQRKDWEDFLQAMQQIQFSTNRDVIKCQNNGTEIKAVEIIIAAVTQRFMLLALPECEASTPRYLTTELKKDIKEMVTNAQLNSERIRKILDTKKNKEIFSIYKDLLNLELCLYNASFIAHSNGYYEKYSYQELMAIASVNQAILAAASAHDKPLDGKSLRVNLSGLIQCAKQGYETLQTNVVHVYLYGDKGKLWDVLKVIGKNLKYLDSNLQNFDSFKAGKQRAIQDFFKPQGLMAGAGQINNSVVRPHSYRL